MLASLQYAARCTCGYCHISDVEFHQQEDHMESFFLAETVSHLGFQSTVMLLQFSIQNPINKQRNLTKPESVLDEQRL